jgi:hypothetical protein
MFHVKRRSCFHNPSYRSPGHNRHRCSPDALTTESLPPFHGEFRLTQECFGSEMDLSSSPHQSPEVSMFHVTHCPESSCLPRIGCKGAIDANQCRLPTVWSSGPRSCIRRRLIAQSTTEIADHSPAAYAARDTDETAALAKGELRRGLG